MRATPVLLGVAGLFTLGWSATPTPDDFVRQGNAAFERQDYQAAVDLYARAEERTTDPGLVAFNKATACYRVGRFAEAAAGYRRCLEDEQAPPERRARAFYDLGNALVKQSGDASAALLAQAVR